MRLEPREIEAIKTAAREAFGPNAVVRLFGSRVHDHLLGGDIDLLIETEAERVGERQEDAFFDGLFRRIEERRVDLLVKPTGKPPTPIEEIALRDGILL